MPYLNIGTADIPIEELHAPTPDPDTVAAIAGRLVGRLKDYPHFVLVGGLPAGDDGDLTKRIAQAIADTPPVKPRQAPSPRARLKHFVKSASRGHPLNGLRMPDPLPDLWFSRIEIMPGKPATDGRVTTYSRTSKPLDLHTDCSYRYEPQELIVFQMVRDDPEGGDTLMSAVEDISDNLDDGVRETLMRPEFPFGPKTPLPVLWTRSGGFNIRFYETQIDTARQQNHHLTARQLEALEALSTVIRREEVQFRFHIEAGETIFIHNTKALHGRTAFPDGSRRLMYRIRIPAGCLN